MHTTVLCLIQANTGTPLNVKTVRLKTREKAKCDSFFHLQILAVKLPIIMTTRKQSADQCLVNVLNFSEYLPTVTQ